MSKKAEDSARRDACREAETLVFDLIAANREVVAAERRGNWKEYNHAKVDLDQRCRAFKTAVSTAARL